MEKITIKNPCSAIKLTREQAISLGISPTEEHQLGNMETQGLWNTPISFKALCLSKTFDKSKAYTTVSEVVLYGLRTISRPKQVGYELEGQVSINGKKHSAFTSSQLFEIDGLCINVATIHARV